MGIHLAPAASDHTRAPPCLPGCCHGVSPALLLIAGLDGDLAAQTAGDGVPEAHLDRAIFSALPEVEFAPHQYTTVTMSVVLVCVLTGDEIMAGGHRDLRAQGALMAGVRAARDSRQAAVQISGSFAACQTPGRTVAVRGERGCWR
jgi:hypothetical protein